MNKSNYIFIGIILVVVVLLVAWLAWPSDVDWSTDYQIEEQHPYDTYIFHELIKGAGCTKELVEVKDSLSRVLHQEVDVPGSYIFIGQSFYGNPDDVVALLDYVAEGHQAFIIAEDPGTLLYEVCDLEDTEDWQEKEDGTYALIQSNWWSAVSDTLIVAYNEDAKGHEFNHRIQYFVDFEVKPFQWIYFNGALKTENDSMVRVIGGFDGTYNNAIEVPHGEGKFYFHSTPLAFSNYHLKTKSGMDYCRAFMSYLQAGKVYWDIENQTIDFFPEQHDEAGGETKPQQGPLEYMLSQPALAAAWYLSLVLVVLYLLFAGRRRQRAIRTIQSPRNTSIEFTEVVSQLFQKQKDHRKLVEMKMEMWRSHARERYRIRWTDKSLAPEPEVLADWSLRSGVPQDLLNRILETYNGLDTLQAVETPVMLQLHSLLETYYHNCK